MTEHAPLIIEVAINGSISKSEQPSVPLTIDDMVDDIVACADAGAQIFHVHCTQVWDKHVPDNGYSAYRTVFSRVLSARPGLVLYPSMPAAGNLSAEHRFEHALRLAADGLAALVPCDPVTLNWGIFDPEGTMPDTLYKNPMSETAYVFQQCTHIGAGSTLSIFEPGGLALAVAHHRNGTLPKATIVKLEFSQGDLLFGLPPTGLSIDAYLQMMAGTGMPWMVTLRGGDIGREFGSIALEKGGHVRVGLEDYGGPRQPSNETLVREIVERAKQCQRTIATHADTRALIGLPA